MSNANFITLFWRNFCHKYTHGVMMSNSLKISHKKRYVIQLIFTSASERTLLSVDIRAAIKAEVDIFVCCFFFWLFPTIFPKETFLKLKLIQFFYSTTFFLWTTWISSTATLHLRHGFWLLSVFFKAKIIRILQKMPLFHRSM